jgi:hypothetical protein
LEGAIPRERNTIRSPDARDAAARQGTIAIHAVQDENTLQRRLYNTRMTGDFAFISVLFKVKQFLFGLFENYSRVC